MYFIPCLLCLRNHAHRGFIRSGINVRNLSHCVTSNALVQHVRPLAKETPHLFFAPSHGRDPMKRNSTRPPHA
eukprot:1269238-Prorocentrum_lima.AAC.1